MHTNTRAQRQMITSEGAEVVVGRHLDDTSQDALRAVDKVEEHHEPQQPVDVANQHLEKINTSLKPQKLLHIQQ